MARGSAGAVVTLVVLLGMPWAGAGAGLTQGATTARTASLPAGDTGDVVVVGTTVTATSSDGATTATIDLINTADTDVPLTSPVVGEPSCVVGVAPTSLPPKQGTTVTLTLQPGCPADETVAVDLDARGPLPVLTVKPAEPSESSFTPLRTGVQFAMVGALVTLLVGFLAFRTARAGASAPSVKARDLRERRYRVLTSLVQQRLESLGATDVRWLPLPNQTYGLSATIANLKAGWSFQESWVTSLTAGTSAIIALASSSDLFASLLGEAPSGALRIPAVAALAAAALIAVAVLVVKLLGSTADEVTVGGLVLSTALVAAAAVLNIITAAVAASDLLESDLWSQVVRFAGFAVAVLLTVYAGRSLWHTVMGGVAEPVPAVPDDPVQAWAASDDWERTVVLTRLRTEYEKFLSSEPEATPSAPMTADEVKGVQLHGTWDLAEPVASLI